MITQNHHSQSWYQSRVLITVRDFHIKNKAICIPIHCKKTIEATKRNLYLQKDSYKQYCWILYSRQFVFPIKFLGPLIKKKYRTHLAAKRLVKFFSYGGRCNFVNDKNLNFSAGVGHCELLSILQPCDKRYKINTMTNSNTQISILYSTIFNACYLKHKISTFFHLILHVWGKELSNFSTWRSFAKGRYI